MKNKIILVFLIFIFNSSYFNSLTAEEFNFDTTELQVTENGNLIKGIDGGKITSKNNEIVITADTFIYNKFTTLLEAEGNVKLVDKIEDIIIETNKIFYLKNKEEIYTIGKSKATNGVNIEIDANEYFRYNKLTSLLEAKGDVVLNDRIKDITIYTDEIFYLQNEEKIYTLGETNIDVENEYKVIGHDLTLLRNEMILSSKKKTIIKDTELNIYKLEQFQYSINKEILKGKNITVITNDNKSDNDEFFFKTGFFNFKENKFLSKDVFVKLHKDLFGNKKNDPRINSVSAKGDELNTYYEKAVFTSCKKTDKCPPWKMTAAKIHHDKNKKQIIYRDAWLELYDFPVAYFPKFFHPDPTVKRQSGLLSPAIGDHNTLGDSIYLPYFFVISDSKDITVKPRLFNSDVFIIQNEYRQITKNSLTIVDSSVTTGHNSSNDDAGDTRSHFFANSKINLNFKNFISSNLKINYEKTSNDNYLKLFDFINSPLLFEKDNTTLESFVELDLRHEDYDLLTSFEMYETLSGHSSDRYQYVLPSFNFSKNFFLENYNGSLNFNSSGNNTLKETNKFTSALFNDLNYSSFNYFFENGIKTNFEIALKNINTMGKNDTIYKNSPQSELMSAYYYNVSLPLKKNDENSINTLIPKLTFMLSPHEMKNNSDTLRRIDNSNVFSTNRLGLGNSFEEGESVTLGIDFIKEKINTEDEITKIENYFDIKLASVFRLNKEKNIPINSTLDKKSSNIFGQVNFQPNKNISINYNTSLTNDFNRFEYNAFEGKFTFHNFSTSINYLEESGDIGESNVIENTAEYNLNEFNSLSFRTRRNRNLNLTEYYNLVYEYKNDCLIANIRYNKDYYNDADIKPKEELFFSITIVPFYTYSPDKIALNQDRID
jgi:LPS-assembly protein